jgi:ribosomal protein S18 acetylase RimI-like enzyme
VSDGLRIRPADPADAAAIARVYVESAAHHTRIDPARYRVPRHEHVTKRYAEGRQLPHDIAPDRRATLVAERDGAIVGFVDAHLDAQAETDTMQSQWSFVYVEQLAVAEAERRTGVGDALLSAVEEWGRANGAEFSFLQVLAANDAAVRFYTRRMGYAPASHNMMKRLRLS